MSDVLSASTSVVKRRNRTGRTPWRRIYSCIEPATLLFAQAQDLQDLNNKFDYSLNRIHDNTKKRVHSTRHFEVNNAFSDISQLKNRQVSIKFSSSGTFPNRKNTNATEKQTSEKALFVPKTKAKNLKEMRIRRHTVSGINYRSPLLTINETTEGKAIQVNKIVSSSGAKTPEENQVQIVSVEDRDLQDKIYTKEPTRVNRISKTGCKDDTEVIGLPFYQENVYYGNSLEYNNNKETKMSDNMQPDISHTEAVSGDEDDITGIDMNENIIKGFNEFKLNDSGIQSRDSEIENSENNSSIDFDTESEPGSDTCAIDNIKDDKDKKSKIPGPGCESDVAKCELNENEARDIKASLDEVVNTVVTNERELTQCTKIDDDFDCENKTNYEDVSKSTDARIAQNCLGYSRRDSEPNIRYQEANTRHQNSQDRQTKRGFMSDKGFKRLYQLAISGMVGRTMKKPTVSDFIALLESKGIRTNDPRLKESKIILTESNKDVDFTQEKFARIHLASFPLIRNVLLSQMTIPGLSVFKTKMLKVFENLSAILLDLEKERIKESKDVITDPTSNYLDFILSRKKPGDTWLSMAVCTADGQRLSFGETENLHPLDCCSDVLNYCIACTQNGIDVMKSYIGRAPQTNDMNEFAMTENDKVSSPFTKTGVLMTTAFQPPGDSTETRMSILHDYYSRAMANEPLCCDNLSYNLKRLYAHEEIALAYLLSARHKLPKLHNAIPGDILELHFQSSSSAATSSACSVAAATLANGGVCPLTGELIFKEDIVKHAVKRLKTCHTTLSLNDDHSKNHGLSFIWSESGCMMLIVPGVLGLVCFVQGISRHAIAELAAHLFKDITSSFNFSVYRSLKRRIQQT